MKIIYISTVMSNKKQNDIIKNAKLKPLQSIQKFHRLFCEGLQKNGVHVETISAIPMSRKINKRVFWSEKPEIENEVKYNYIPFINFPIIRQICLCLCLIGMIIKQCNGKEKKVIICDILNTTISFTTLLLKFFLKYKCVAIVTDLPKHIGKQKSLSQRINIKCEKKYDAYIFLTGEMNNVINKDNKPNIVIEGFADIKMQNIENKIENKYDKKVCIYAGGLYEKYGVKNLVEGFRQVSTVNAELHIYGSGELEEYLNSINDNRIKFFGVVQNERIIEEELKATLLINPRFTKDEYTKYSFPSKNIEYMSTGTPLLTTRLLGIPEEYNSYVFFIEDESINGMKKCIEEVLCLSSSILNKTGEDARQFVLNKKNNIVQANQFLKMIGE